MVLDVASYIKSMVKTDTICIDNFVFRLHYRVTVAILLAASIIGRLTQNRLKVNAKTKLSSMTVSIETV